MWRDHERQRRVGRRPVPGREHDLRGARMAVVGDVVNAHPPHGGHTQRRRRPAAAVADDHLQPAGEPAQVERLAERFTLRKDERRSVHRHRLDALATRQPDPELQSLRGRPSRRLHDRADRVAARLQRVRDRPEARRRAPHADPASGPQPRARRREAELEPGRRALGVPGLVDEERPQRLQERGVARPVRRQVHRAEVTASQRCDARRLARDERVRRHPHGQRAVEAQHELVGVVAVRQEAGDVGAVDLVGPGDRVDRLLVERVGTGADEADEARPVAEHVLEHAFRLRALRGEDPGRERIGHDEVPVAAELRLGQGAVRGLAVEQAGRDEERAVAEPPLRGRDRAPNAGLELLRERLAAPRELRVAGVGPDAAHRPEALPHGRLRVQPEHLVRNVRRIALTAEQPAAARPDLAPELVDVAPQRRRRTVDVGAIAREPVVERRPDEPLAHLPVRIRHVLPRQRGAQDRTRDAGVPELAHHLCDVDALRERELLVGVADAVAPGQQQVLDQQVAIGVVDAPLRDGDLACPRAAARSSTRRRRGGHGRSGRRRRRASAGPGS